MAMASDVTFTTTTVNGKPQAPPLLSGFRNAAAPPISVRKAVLVYNPVSGNKKGKRIAEKVVGPMMREAGVELVMLPTERAGHAIELAATCDLTGVDALLAMGGDGTLSDVASGFLQREADSRGGTVLGFIPSGTGNTLVHEILGTRPKPPKGDAFVRRAVEVILGGRTRKMDCCKVRVTRVKPSLLGQPPPPLPRAAAAARVPVAAAARERPRLLAAHHLGMPPPPPLARSSIALAPTANLSLGTRSTL